MRSAPFVPHHRKAPCRSHELRLPDPRCPGCVDTTVAKDGTVAPRRLWRLSGGRTQPEATGGFRRVDEIAGNTYQKAGAEVARARSNPPGRPRGLAGAASFGNSRRVAGGRRPAAPPACGAAAGHCPRSRLPLRPRLHPGLPPSRPPSAAWSGRLRPPGWSGSRSMRRFLTDSAPSRSCTGWTG